MEDRISITEGHHRLTLQYDEGHFRALVWSSEHNREWRCRAVITQADFQRGTDRERWVNELHSFDPATGRAIIKVGEMEVRTDKAGHGGFRRCIYSWREWDLLASCEVQVLRLCEEPFEQYETPCKVHRAIVSAGSDSVVIDCKVEDWDGCLYDSLYSRRPIELINLHPSREQFMKQLAELHHMDFAGEFANCRGKFRPRNEKDQS